MNFAKINLFDIANGEGLRVSLFLSGCKFQCKDCFNEEAWDFNYGKKFTEDYEKLILERLAHPDFRGLSLLGGDALWQDEDGLRQLINLCQKVHSLGKDIWLWSGFTWEEVMNPVPLSKQEELRQELIKNCDIFVDGRFHSHEKDLSIAWRGSRNQRIINVKDKLAIGENHSLINFFKKGFFHGKN